MTTKLQRLGNLQLKILKVLWERGEASVAEVYQDPTLSADLAYTTVATMLRKMETRGLVKHRTDGRTFIYRAAVAAEAVTRNMADDLLDRLFAGSLANMVTHLLATHEVSSDELSRLERLIAERRKKK